MHCSNLHTSSRSVCFPLATFIDSLRLPFPPLQRAAPLPRVKPSVRSVRSTLIAVYLLVTMLLTNLSFTILAPFLALESAKRDVNGAAMGFIFSVNYLICVVACPVFGGMLQAKQVGSTTLMAFGTITIGIGSALFGLVMPGITRPAPFIAMGLLFRAMVGLGSAAVDTAGTSLMVTLAMDAGYKHVGQAVGLVETSMAIGEALGPIFGGFMYEAGGFRAPFLAAGFFVSFSGPTLLIIMRHLTAAQPEHESKGGFLAEQMVVYKKTAEVFSHLRMFILVLPTFLGCSSMTWLDATLAPFAASRFHMKPHEVGFAFTLFNVVYAIACPLAGWVAGMVGDVRTLGAGLLACSISFFMVVRLCLDVSLFLCIDICRGLCLPPPRFSSFFADHMKETLLIQSTTAPPGPHAAPRIAARGRGPLHRLGPLPALRRGGRAGHRPGLLFRPRAARPLRHLLAYGTLRRGRRGRYAGYDGGHIEFGALFGRRDRGAVGGEPRGSRGIPLGLDVPRRSDARGLGDSQPII